MSVKCVNCGQEVSETSKFCTNCGAPLSTVSENFSEPESTVHVQEENSQTVLNGQTYVNGNTYGNAGNQQPKKKNGLSVVIVFMLIAALVGTVGFVIFRSMTANSDREINQVDVADAVGNPVATINGRSNNVITAEDKEDVVIANVGDIVETAFFEYKVNRVDLYEEYDGIDIDDDQFVVSVNISLYNPYSWDVKMYDTDFLLGHVDRDTNATLDDTEMYPVTFEEDLEPFNNMLDGEYEIEAGETINGELVFLMSDDSTYFTLFYIDLYESEDSDYETGASYFVDFDFNY